MNSHTRLSNHLKERRLNPINYHCYLDNDNNIATFYLFNLSGQFIGYQTYNPGMPKFRTNLTPKEQRYYTYITGKKDERMNAVWGLERYNFRKEVLLITEGIFDACVFHNLGYNAVACLANNPLKLRSMFKAMGHKLIGIADGDEAGMKIANISDSIIIMPSGKDANDLTDKELIDILKENKLY